MFIKRKRILPAFVTIHNPPCSVEKIFMLKSLERKTTAKAPFFFQILDAFMLRCLKLYPNSTTEGKKCAAGKTHLGYFLKLLCFCRIFLFSVRVFSFCMSIFELDLSFDFPLQLRWMFRSFSFVFSDDFISFFF